MHFDVFNGDADGIIALIQLRLAEPKQAKLVTGVKRDIALLKQVDPSTATSVTVLDVSMEKNQAPLAQLLDNNIPVLYIDHHRSGDISDNDALEAIIDLDANICTSLLVNERLQSKYVRWAIAAAYGDNMTASADALADKHELTDAQKASLKALGIYVNYNGYGREVGDLHFHPADLFLALVKYEDPLQLVAESGSVFHQLALAYKNDMAQAEEAEVVADNEVCKVVRLPDQAWSRRVSGVYGNELANSAPDKAHAVLTNNADGSFTVSVRAPLNNKTGADQICVQFPTGGGRAGAAGINALPAEMLASFIETLSKYYA